jgi:hypothetical protein
MFASGRIELRWLLLGALISCGPGCQWDVGSVDIRLVYSTREDQNPLDPVRVGVRKLRLRVEGDSISPRVTELALGEDGGGFADIPVGERIRVMVEGLDGSGYVRSRGVSAPIVTEAREQALFLYLSLVGELSGPPSTTELSAPGFAERYRTRMRTGAGRAFHAAADLPDGLLLVAGGVGQEPRGDPLARRLAASVFRTAERFDPTAGAFLQDEPGEACASGDRLCLQAGRAFFGFTLLPGRETLLAVGGEPIDAEFAAETFEPGLARFYPARVGLARPRSRAAVVALDSPERAQLVVGGVDAAGQLLDAIELFDAERGLYAEVGRLSEARAGPAAVLTPVGVLVLGGFRRFEEWPTLGEPVRDPSGRIDRVTFGGGGVVVESLGELAEPRAEASAVWLGGEVLVCGGLSGALTTLASCELVDPRTGLSRPTDSVLFPRYRHTATPLEDGRVLVAGGFALGGVSAALNSAVLLDPLGGRRPVRLTMVARRAGHTASALGNGMVLLAGGQAESGAPAIEDYELFNP